MLKSLSVLCEEFERFLWKSFGAFQPQFYEFLPAVVTNRENVCEPRIEKDSIFDRKGILWAVPAFRRSLERRMKRKFGHPDYVYKLHHRITNLKICHYCGSTHEYKRLCPNCYQRVINETKEMQDKIQEELKLDPVDKEVVVLYDGEKSAAAVAGKTIDDNATWEGKRIVEMKKPRPAWFSKNLLEKTTQTPSTSTELEPKHLA